MTGRPTADPGQAGPIVDLTRWSSRQPPIRIRRACTDCPLLLPVASLSTQLSNASDHNHVGAYVEPSKSYVPRCLYWWCRWFATHNAVVVASRPIRREACASIWAGVWRVPWMHRASVTISYRTVMICGTARSPRFAITTFTTPTQTEESAGHIRRRKPSPMTSTSTSTNTHSVTNKWLCLIEKLITVIKCTHS